MKNNKQQIKKLSLLSMLTAAALILSYVEAILPPIFSAVPGIKVGLANIVIIWILYHIGFSAALMVSLVRIVIVSLLFGSPISFLYSLAGALLSLVIMMMLKKLNFLSVVGVSVSGGVFHNLGQILMAMFLLGTASIGYYMIVLTITGIVAGVFIGLCSAFLINRFPKK